jgi:hypothetical protein
MARKKAPFVPGVMRCDTCDKVITGEHLMTIKSEWKGFGSPPENAIAHVCSAACKRKLKELGS